MNCANHPERPATAFCQSCGKPLCHECTRVFDGLLLCEPDFLTRAGSGTAAAGTGNASGPGTVDGAVHGHAAGYRPVGWAPATGQYPAAPVHTSPAIAALLGFIPGVGAMYNGQFIKALLHVVVLIMLIGASEHFDLAGILIAAWVFYQVFDAAQTASARRDGRPLPDPFGILDMSQKLGPQGQGSQPTYGAAPYAYRPMPPASATTQHSNAPGVEANPFPGAGHASGQAAGVGSESGPVYAHNPGAGNAPVSAGFGAVHPGPWQSRQTPGSPSTPYAPVPPPWPPSAATPGFARRSEPVGAIVLIVVGLLFLLSTLGVLDTGWIARGWPLLVLVLGIWLLIRRLSTPVPPAPYMPQPVYGQGASSTPPPSDFRGARTEQPGTEIVRTNPLSITSRPSVEEGPVVRTDEEER